MARTGCPGGRPARVDRLGPADRAAGGSRRREKRQYLQEEFLSEITRLKEKLVTRFQLTEADLPHSPQERMAEP